MGMGPRLSWTKVKSVPIKPYSWKRLLFVCPRSEIKIQPWIVLAPSWILHVMFVLNETLKQHFHRPNAHRTAEHARVKRKRQARGEEHQSVHRADTGAAQRRRSRALYQRPVSQRHSGDVVRSSAVVWDCTNCSGHYWKCHEIRMDITEEE